MCPRRGHQGKSRLLPLHHLQPFGRATGTDWSYSTQQVYIKYVLSHAEYDKDKWKD
ncbi:MAG: type II toxin-antitoxin system HigB family toxin [Pseudomonas sp.]|nr:type II toxin-antitoxin system HigB family toxin [Pseudomonas sp.]